MATIHPSRMALISQAGGQSQAYSSRRRSPSPARRRRSSTPVRSRSRERARDRDRDGDRDMDFDRSREEHRRSGRRDSDARRDSDRDGPKDRRRGSPQYDDYRKLPPSKPEGQAPWRQQENMYPNRQPGRGRPPQAGGWLGGSDFIESRRLQRESQVVDVWPPSPKAPARDLSPKRSKSSRKSKRARSPSTSETSSDEERRRRARKEKKRSRKEKGSERRRHRSRSRSRSRRKSYDDDSEDNRRKRETRRSTTKSKTRSKSRELPQHSPSRLSELEEDEWVVKAPMAPPPVPLHSEARAAEAPPSFSRKPDEDSDSEDVGPQPLPKVSTRRVDERSYGGALLRGEGSAMAAFLQEGTEARIPRRGEIGLTSDEIAKYEDVGYVMSGSRHRRMNAVRMRKENQVISAEEKRGILKLQREERERREAILREEFSELVTERLKGVPEPKT